MVTPATYLITVSHTLLFILDNELRSSPPFTITGADGMTMLCFNGEYSQDSCFSNSISTFVAVLDYSMWEFYLVTTDGDYVVGISDTSYISDGYPLALISWDGISFPGLALPFTWYPVDVYPNPRQITTESDYMFAAGISGFGPSNPFQFLWSGFTNNYNPAPTYTGATLQFDGTDFGLTTADPSGSWSYSGTSLPPPHKKKHEI